MKIGYIQNYIYYVAWSYQLFVINTCVSNAAFADKRSSCVLGKSVSVLLGKRPTDFAQICWSTTVTQLPIRNCRERSNIFDAKWRNLNAIDVTQKTMHERLLLVSGPLSTAFLWTCSWRPHSHHFPLPLILEINQSSLKGATFGKNHLFETCSKSHECRYTRVDKKISPDLSHSSGNCIKFWQKTSLVRTWLVRKRN